MYCTDSKAWDGNLGDLYSQGIRLDWALKKQNEIKARGGGGVPYKSIYVGAPRKVTNMSKFSSGSGGSLGNSGGS
jgi:hypothetical protein